MRKKTHLLLDKTRIDGRLFWQVTVPKLGKGRTRKTFKNREEAQAFFDEKKIELENHGKASVSIPDSLRVEAIECAEKLKEFGKGLRDATEFYVAHLRSIEKSQTVSDVVKELLTAKEADGASVRYVGDLRARLARFTKDFGTAMIATISTKQINDWLRGLNLAPLTRNTFRLRLAALFSFANRSGYVAVNPMEEVDRAKVREGEIEILTIEQLTALLGAAAEETLPYWAIGAFAGLRTAELERLHWEEVDLADGLIEVKSGKSKTGSRRHVPMSDNLRAWLAPYKATKGPLCPKNLRVKLEADREKAKIEEWPQNGLRHSFGSYRFPILGDAGKLAVEMGNSPEMIFKHYRELVKPAVAKMYWNILPGKLGQKVRRSGKKFDAAAREIVQSFFGGGE